MSPSGVPISNEVWSPKARGTVACADVNPLSPDVRKLNTEPTGGTSPGPAPGLPSAIPVTRTALLRIPKASHWAETSVSTAPILVPAAS